MANASRSGKPLPQDLTRSSAGTPTARPAPNTSTVAASANTKASGSHRSANAVNASATRESPFTGRLYYRSVFRDREDLHRLAGQRDRELAAARRQVGPGDQRRAGGGGVLIDLG